MSSQQFMFFSLQPELGRLPARVGTNNVDEHTTDFETLMRRYGGEQPVSKAPPLINLLHVEPEPEVKNLGPLQFQGPPPPETITVRTPPRFATPYVHQSYPKWKYHRKKEAVIVQTASEEARLGPGWEDSPAAFK